MEPTLHSVELLFGKGVLHWRGTVVALVSVVVLVVDALPVFYLLQV